MDEKLKNTFSPIKSEMYQLLLTCYCYEKKMKNLPGRLRHESRIFLLEEITSLRHLANGVILHICNLDDDGSKGSIRAITGHMTKEAREYIKLGEKSNQLMKEYRTKINSFKTKHRNSFIAHRKGEDYPNPFDLPDYSKEFKEIIRMALSILEGLWGRPLEFFFELGSQEPTIDLKAELGLT